MRAAIPSAARIPLIAMSFGIAWISGADAYRLSGWGAGLLWLWTCAFAIAGIICLHDWISDRLRFRQYQCPSCEGSGVIYEEKEKGLVK